MARIRVELYGVARQRAGVAETMIETNDDQLRLGEVLGRLLARFPTLADECIDDQRLLPGFAANIDGERFVNAPDELLPGSCSLLIMSSDAGG